MEKYRKLLPSWFEENNNHPDDDKRFYELVLKSKDEKISLDIFEAVIGNNGAAENVYKRYEDLRNFLFFIQENKED